MRRIESYFTKEGWVADLETTRDRHPKMYNFFKERTWQTFIPGWNNYKNREKEVSLVKQYIAERDEARNSGDLELASELNGKIIKLIDEQIRVLKQTKF